MIHDGHRERLRSKADTYGMECLEPHELLELLLGYSIARRNTNEMAHDLINRAGGLREVFDMRDTELVKSDGVGYQTSFMIRLIGFIMNRPKVPPKSRVWLGKLSELEKYADMLFGGATEEKLYVLLLDPKFKLIKRTLVSDGSAWQVGADKKKIARASVDEEASAAILIHNHPRGDAVPTRDDLNFTVEIERTFSAIGIPLLEHLVYADGKCYPIMRRTKQSASFAIEYDDITEV